MTVSGVAVVSEAVAEVQSRIPGWLREFFRLMVLFPLVSALIIGGFGISRIMSGEYAIAAFDLVVAFSFLGLGTYTYMTGHETASRYLSALVSLVGPLYFLDQGNTTGIFWVYSSAVVFYYLIPLRWAIACNVAIIAGVVYIWSAQSVGPVMTYSFVFTIGLVNLYSASFTNLTERSIRDRLKLEQAEREVAQLRTLLPICASCHKIRDEEGDWHQMEMYLDKFRATRFSHGICPTCARELYPEI